jgi:hypothetical protein
MAMRTKAMLLLILAMLALAPDRVLAQTKTYSCPPGTGNGATCIDSITAVPSAGSASIIVHWLWMPCTQPNVVCSGKLPDFYQLHYAYPGSPDTQVKLPGGAAQGVYNLALLPTADPNGDHTFKIQGCFNQPLLPASCLGGNQQPWDVEVFTISGMPGPTVSGQSKTPGLTSGASSKSQSAVPAVSCAAGLKQVASPCSCITGLNQPSACDASGTAACLSGAQLAKVPKCPGTQYLVCGNLPAIASRDAGGNWFNKVTLKCQAVQASASPSGKTEVPPKGTGLPVSNQQNK